MDDGYYLVPINDEHTYLDENRICDLCEEKITLIQKKKEELSNKKSIFGINKLFDKHYESLMIPEYLIVIQQGDDYRELMTGLSINTDDAFHLKKYQVDESEKILHYFVTSKYKERIVNFIKNSKLRKDKKLIKRISES